MSEPITTKRKRKSNSSHDTNMKGFHFERDLAHQKQAVENTIAVFHSLQVVHSSEAEKNCINPTIEWEKRPRIQKKH